MRNSRFVLTSGWGKPIALHGKIQQMATVVKHLRTNSKYVLLGSGFGAFQSKKPNWLLGNIMSDTTEGQYAMTCVCDIHGKIYWVASDELVVDSIDGNSAFEVLS